MLSVSAGTTRSYDVGDTANAGVADLDGQPGKELYFVHYPTITVLILDAVATHFRVAGPAGATAGSTFAVTLTALDAADHPVTDYTGTVHFTSSDPQAALPANYTFTAADRGVHTFSVTLKTAGSRSITATDTVTGSLTGTLAGIQIDPAAASVLNVAGFPSPVVAGTAANLTVTLKDAYGNLATGYRGTVHFSSTDGQASLPADYTFTAADAASRTFTVTLKTASIQALAVTDTVNAGLAAQVYQSAEFPLPSAGSQPRGITAGPDGNFWFAEYSGGKIGKITPAGTITEFGVPGNPIGITAGPDGNLWFAEYLGNKIGRITPAGVLTEFPVPTAGSGPAYITLGPDGNLWFTEYAYAGNKIGRITPSGVITEFPIPTGSSTPFGITAGPDGNVWFAEYSGGKIGKITPTGMITEFRIPAPGSASAITLGPDNNLWFTEPQTNKIGRITPAGVISEFVLQSISTGITAGRDGNLWFIESGNVIDKIGRITPTGTITEFSVLTGGGQSEITAGPDGNLWFTENNRGKIGRLTPGVVVQAAPASGFTVSAPAGATAGTPIAVTVTAQDPFNNTATGYAGTVHFTSSDAQATLPADATLTRGSGTFMVTLRTGGSRTVTATDTVTSSITGTSDPIQVTQAGVTHFGISAPANATAGTAFTITVTALDAANNVVTGYSGTVHFTSTDAQAVLPTDATLSNGTGTFSVTLKTAAASARITATDTVTCSLTGTSPGIAVSPAAAASFLLTVPASATAGTAIAVTVTALDAYNNTATTYAGTVHFTSTDPQAVLPANTTLSNGTGTFSVTLKTAASASVTATDTVTGSITGTSPGINVSPAAAASFLLTVPASATAGTAIAVTVTALDAYNNTATTYAGTVHFTSTDPQAVLPADATLTNGAGTFSVTLKTAGGKTVTARDTANGSVTGTSTAVTVNPAAAALLAVAAPAATTAGNAITVTVTARDAYGNTATGYTGTVRFTSSDGQASLPANATLTGGTGTFSVTLKTAPSQTITATDTVVGSITGSATVAVSAAAASRFTVTAPATAPAGAAFNITVTAKDAYNNTATAYAGTVRFTSNDPQAVLPANSTLTNGTGAFSVTLKTAAASATVTATDTVTGSITGTSPGINVSPAAASRFTITAPANATGGVAFSITVTAKDPYGNTATGYAGTVHFSSDDGQATRPANSTLASGTGTFTVTLRTGGNRTVTATDTVTSSITGSATVLVSTVSATHFGVTAPASATAGAAFTITVTALDAADNVVTGYTGTVHFSSMTDALAVLPADTTLTNGTGSFPVTLKTAGNQTVTATDTAIGSLTGTSGSINDGPAAADHFKVAANSGGTGVTAGTAFNVTVTAYDPYTNLATGYTGTVHFTSSDSQAVLPADATLTNGSRTFTATLKSAGTQTLTAADTANATLSGSALGVTNFTVPTAGNPRGITAGPDGNLWFTEINSNQIGRITPAGVVTEFPVPGAGNPVEITAGADGNLWFTEVNGNKVGRITPAGVVTEFPVPTANSGPYAISRGPDNNVWFTEAQAAKLGRITPAGVVTEFPVATVDRLSGLTQGPDGNLWVTGYFTDRIAKVTTAGTVAGLYALPHPGSEPFKITAGPDGNLWFTEANALRVGRVSTAGVITEFAVTGTAQDRLGWIAAGADGNLWVTLGPPGGDRVGRMTPAGAYTDQVVPGNNPQPAGITRGPDDNMWIAEAGNNNIGRVMAGVTVKPAAAASFSVVPSVGTVTAGTALDVTVTARDAYGNTATGYTGTVHFGGTDTQAVLPADSPLTNGVGTFPVTLKTAGGQTVTAVDTVNGAIQGASPPVTVNPAAAAGFSLTAPGSVTAGTAFTLTVTALDAYGNTATGYTGTVTFGSSDAQAILPADTTLAGGTGDFSVTLQTVGTQTVTAMDTLDASITGTSNPIAVTAAGPFREYSTLPATLPWQITPGPDGNLWFTLAYSDKIGYVTPSGSVTLFTLPTVCGFGSIVAGPDGNLWFTDAANNQIGQITLTGDVTYFPIPTANSTPITIVVGPDGNLWFTEEIGQLAQLTLDGTITEYALPPDSGASGLVAGPDGNLWITETGRDMIGRFSLEGTLTEFPIPTGDHATTAITVGPDGNLWFAETNANQIGRLTLDGTFTFTEFPLAGANPGPAGLTAGPDGNVWFTESNMNNIAQITPDGTITEWTLPRAGVSPLSITTGPDGNLWFTEYTGSGIGEYVFGLAPRGGRGGNAGKPAGRDVRKAPATRTAPSPRTRAAGLDFGNERMAWSHDFAPDAVPLSDAAGSPAGGSGPAPERSGAAPEGAVGGTATPAAGGPGFRSLPSSCHAVDAFFTDLDGLLGVGLGEILGEGLPPGGTIRRG